MKLYRIAGYGLLALQALSTLFNGLTDARPIATDLTFSDGLFPTPHETPRPTSQATSRVLRERGCLLAACNKDLNYLTEFQEYASTSIQESPEGNLQFNIRFNLPENTTALIQYQASHGFALHVEMLSKCPNHQREHKCKNVTHKIEVNRETNTTAITLGITAIENTDTLVAAKAFLEALFERLCQESGGHSRILIKAVEVALCQLEPLYDELLAESEHQAWHEMLDRPVQNTGIAKP